MMTRAQIKFFLEKSHSRILKLIGKLPKSLTEGFVPVFIVSTGRTGTHFFAHFINNNFKGVLATHEPKKDIFSLNMSYSRGEVSEKLVKTMFLYYRKHIFKKLNQKNINLYVESNNNLSYILREVASLFDDYRIIYLTRDGKDYVRSLYSKTTSSKRVKDVPVLSDADPRDRLKPGYFKNDPYYGKWRQMSRFERACWTWQKKNELIQSHIELDRKAVTYKFEELFLEQNEKKWGELLTFIGFDSQPDFSTIKEYLNQARSNETKVKKIGKWDDWPLDYRQTFVEIAGAQMTKQGYLI